MNSRLLSIIRKEFIHIIRDRRSLAIMFVIPIIQLILLGYAATTDIRRLNTAVYDADRTIQSRQLVEAYRASDYFAIGYNVGSESEIAELLDRGAVRAGIIIPSGYGDNLAKGSFLQRVEDGDFGGVVPAVAPEMRDDLPARAPECRGELRLGEMQTFALGHRKPASIMGVIGIDQHAVHIENYRAGCAHFLSWVNFL